jgi:hypothetical protein
MTSIQGDVEGFLGRIGVSLSDCNQGQAPAIGRVHPSKNNVLPVMGGINPALTN